MCASTTTASWASLQSRVVMPRSKCRSRKDKDVKVGSTDEHKTREPDDMERILSDFKAQRLGSRIKRSTNGQAAAVVPIRSSSSSRIDKTSSLKSSWHGSRRSIEDFSTEDDDGFVSGNESNPANAAALQSFQDQVLEEIRKLKEAQRIEFEALERLEREKNEAERKARRLEQQLRKARQLRLKEGASLCNADAVSRAKLHAEIRTDSGLDEGSNDRTYSSNRSDVGAVCEGREEEEDLELFDWNEVTTSPPPYFTTASPATSPFKRSSGRPAWTGDEHAPPDMELEAACASSEPSKLRSRRSRSRNKSEVLTLCRPKSDSSMALNPRKCRSPSAFRSSRSTLDNQEVRRSCAFFEEKARSQAEADQLAKEAAQRLARARHAIPPQNLLKRQALAQERKTQQLKDLERQMNDDLVRKRVKARDVPLTTYVPASDAQEAERKRKERIYERAQELMHSAELPPRMAVASKYTTGNLSLNAEDDRHMSVRLKKKLEAAAAEEARGRKPKPKPVPNFDELHAQWEAAVNKRKEDARRNKDGEEGGKEAVVRTSSSAFFTSRAAEVAELQERKKARKLRAQAKEEAMREQVKRMQEKQAARARASFGKDIGSQGKPTKGETLRMQKLVADATKQQKTRQRQEREAHEREQRREETARRVRAQVKRAENVRRGNYTGDFVELKDLDALAKEKAREQRQQFKQAIARNRERLTAAIATRPSLMERFTIDLKRDAHRREALETIVKSVFQKDLATLKGVLTDTEQEVAREMVADDDPHD